MRAVEPDGECAADHGVWMIAAVLRCRDDFLPVAAIGVAMMRRFMVRDAVRQFRARDRDPGH